MCSDWEPGPLNILEGARVKFFCAKLHFYIITISKQVVAWLCHLQERRLFSGGKFILVSVGRADHGGDFYQHNHLSKLKVFAGDRHCFDEEWRSDKELVGQAGGQTLLRLQLRYFTNDSYSYYVTFVQSCNVKLIVRLVN